MDELIAFGAKIVKVYYICKKYKKGNIKMTISNNFEIRSSVEKYYTNLSQVPDNETVTVNIFELFNFLEEIDKNLIISNVFTQRNVIDTDHLYNSDEIKFRFNYEPLNDHNVYKKYILEYNHIFIKIRNGYAIDTYYINITDFKKLYTIMSIYPELFNNQTVNKKIVDTTGYELINDGDNIIVIKNDVRINLGKNFTIFGLLTNLSNYTKTPYINVDINIMINFINHIYKRLITKHKIVETLDSLICGQVEFTFIYNSIRSLGEDYGDYEMNGEHEALEYCYTKGIEYEPVYKYKNFETNTTKIGFNNIIMKIRKSYNSGQDLYITTRILFNMEDYNKVNKVMDLYPDIFIQ